MRKQIFSFFKQAPHLQRASIHSQLARWINQPWNAQQIIGASLIAASIFLVANLLSFEGEAEALVTSQEGSFPGVDTYIPKGMTLVLAELRNSEALDSVLGNHGWVSIYVSGREGPGRSRLLAQNVKILRAPKDPSQFALLVPQWAAAHFTKFDQDYTATLQNSIKPKPAGTNAEEANQDQQNFRLIGKKESVISTRKIFYGGEVQ